MELEIFKKLSKGGNSPRVGNRMWVTMIFVIPRAQHGASDISKVQQ